MQMDVDMKDFMSAMKEMGGDSLMNDKKFDAELENMPKVWTDLYEMQKLDGKKPSTNPDSIKLMKKMFVKSNFTADKKFAGMSLKLDRFTKDDYKALKNSEMKDEKLPIDDTFTNWDGKTLIFDTEKFNLDDLSRSFQQAESQLSSDKDVVDPSTDKAMLQMMLKAYNVTLNFDSNIKEIKGKHDWIKQKSNKSIEINFDLNPETTKKLKNRDKKITIVTE